MKAYVSKIIIFILSVLQVFLISVNPVNANSGVQDPPQLSGAFLATLISKIESLLIPVSVFIALALLIFSGYMWISSAGDPEKVKKASSTITWTVIGLFFIVMVRIIFSLVMDFILK